MNNPPSTRSELVRFFGLRCHSQHEEYQSLEVVADDMMSFIEGWLKTPWETLAGYYHCDKSREDMIADLITHAKDQNTNQIYKIIGRQPWSENGWECAADAMVGLLEAKLRPWEELYRTFNPVTREKIMGERSAGGSLSQNADDGVGLSSVQNGLRNSNVPIASAGDNLLSPTRITNAQGEGKIGQRGRSV